MGELFETAIGRFVFGGMDTIPADRFNNDPQAVRTAIKRLKMGRIVGIFPEGGLRAGPTSVLEGAEMKGGAGALAMMGEVPILPCVILGTDRLYDPKCWRRFQSATIWINFGKMLHSNPDIPKSQARKELNERLSVTLRELYAEAREGFHLSEADLPTTAQRRKGRE